MQPQRIFHSIHRYLNLYIGVYFLLMGTTGSILVFHSEIDEWLNPQLLRVTPQGEILSLEEIMTNVQSTRSPDRIISITFPRSPEGVYELLINSWNSRIYVNPYSGEILGSRTMSGSLMGFILIFHMDLFLGGPIGITLNGMGSILLIVSTLTGLILWWRRSPNTLKTIWRLRLNSGWKHAVLDMHNMWGIHSAIVVLVIALTGVYFSFPLVGNLVQSLAKGPNGNPPLASHTLSEAPLRPQRVSDLVHIANTTLSGGKIVMIRMPLGPRQPFQVRKRFSEDTNPRGSSVVYIDPHSGDVIRTEDSRTASMGQRFINLDVPLHAGYFGGLFTKLLYVVVGIGISIQLITGYLLLWRQK